MTYPSLSLDQEAKAYRELSEHYHLTRAQRAALDASPVLGTILGHAHRAELDVAGGMLVEAGVIGLQQMCDA